MREGLEGAMRRERSARTLNVCVRQSWPVCARVFLYALMFTSTCLHALTFVCAIVALLKSGLIVPCKYVAHPLLSRQNIGGTFSSGDVKDAPETGHCPRRK